MDVFILSLEIQFLASIVSFFQKYLKSVLSHGKSTPWNAMDQENSAVVCVSSSTFSSSIFSFYHFVSSRFQISMNWKCLITIFIEKKYTKFPNVERLDFCEPMKGY